MNIISEIPDDIISFTEEEIKCFENLTPCISTEDSDKSSLLFLFKKASGQIFDTDISKVSAGALITDLDIDSVDLSFPVFKCENAREIMAYSFSVYSGIDYTKLLIIGITGTNGKTTTATLLYEILLYSGIKCGFIGTGKIEICRESLCDYTYSMTTPDPQTLYPVIKRMQDAGCTHIVMEVSSHSIALSKISPIPFVLGAFTNLSIEHTDFHKNMTDYYKVKAGFIKKCKSAIINVDDYYGSILYDEIRDNKTSVGILYSADVKALDIKQESFFKTEFFYKERNLIFKAKLNIIGVCNVYNALIAIKCAIMLGVKPYLAKLGISSIKKVVGRFEIIDDVLTVIVDYAHTPFAFENLLKTIYSLKKHGQRIHTIFGCGGERSKEKRFDMGKTADKYSDFITITEDNSRSESFESISSDILKGIDNKSKVTIIESRKRAIESTIRLCSKNDIVAVVGKGHERYISDNKGTSYFNEIEIINNALVQKDNVKNEN